MIAYDHRCSTSSSRKHERRSGASSSSSHGGVANHRQSSSGMILQGSDQGSGHLRRLLKEGAGSHNSNGSSSPHYDAPAEETMARQEVARESHSFSKSKVHDNSISTRKSDGLTSSDSAPPPTPKEQESHRTSADGTPGSVATVDVVSAGSLPVKPAEAVEVQVTLAPPASPQPNPLQLSVQLLAQQQNSAIVSTPTAPQQLLTLPQAQPQVLPVINALEVYSQPVTLPPVQREVSPESVPVATIDKFDIDRSINNSSLPMYRPSAASTSVKLSSEVHDERFVPSPALLSDQQQLTVQSTAERAGVAAEQRIQVLGSTQQQYHSSRIERGAERVIGYNTVVQEDRIISERIVEHEIKVPKRVIREEVIEKVYVVPETIIREEIVEEIQKVKETIVEVAKPVIHEKIVEVPEYEYREKIVEKVEKIQREKVVEVPKIEYQERIIEVPKIVLKETIKEVPQTEVREVVVEKIVEVPKIIDQVVVKEVKVPQYVDRQVPEYVDVEVQEFQNRVIPKPVEIVTTVEHQVPRVRPVTKKVTYPLYVPRFVEVPVSAELFCPTEIEKFSQEAKQLEVLNRSQALGLCDIENMALKFVKRDVIPYASEGNARDLQNTIAQNLQERLSAAM